MKPSILLPIAILSSFFLTDINAYAATSPIPQTTSHQANNQWIEIGEVTMTYRVLIDTSIGQQYARRECTGVLYVCYIGDKIIYRVNYNGKMYTVSKTDGGYNAYITVDGMKYFLNVPTW